MNRFVLRSILLGFLTLSAITSMFSQDSPPTPDSVKAEFLHAWNAYRQYAWGHDGLKPLTKQPYDWYDTSLCMTPVDAYDTMLIMGLQAEAAEAKHLILDSLRFNRNMEVQSFEITIRLLGGLLSAYQMNRDQRFLSLAEDLGTRLLPVFDTPTGMPYRYVNLLTGKTRDSLNNPAEIGTSLLEFGVLSKLTGKPVFYDKSKRALVELFKRRSSIGLVGTWINVNTGEWTDSTSHIGGMIDSYYEYLFKAWNLFGDKECKAMWDSSFKAVNRYIADTSHGGLWYGQVNMRTGIRTGTRFGSLEAFFPSLLCMGYDLQKAMDLQASCFRMWNLHDIEPEEIDYASMSVISGQYALRPEIIESAFYLYTFTTNPKYREMGRKIFHDLKKYCRTEGGYAELKDVRTKEKADAMQSYFFAETMKYLYFLLGARQMSDFGGYVFTTEAHPLRKMWR